jgi:hypothetical protein
MRLALQRGDPSRAGVAAALQNVWRLLLVLLIGTVVGVRSVVCPTVVSEVEDIGIPMDGVPSIDDPIYDTGRYFYGLPFYWSHVGYTLTLCHSIGRP